MKWCSLGISRISICYQDLDLWSTNVNSTQKLFAKETRATYSDYRIKPLRNTRFEQRVRKWNMPTNNWNKFTCQQKCSTNVKCWLLRNTHPDCSIHHNTIVRKAICKSRIYHWYICMYVLCAYITLQRDEKQETERRQRKKICQPPTTTSTRKISLTFHASHFTIRFGMRTAMPIYQIMLQNFWYTFRYVKANASTQIAEHESENKM